MKLKQHQLDSLRQKRRLDRKAMLLSLRPPGPVRTLAELDDEIEFAKRRAVVRANARVFEDLDRLL